MIMLPPEGVHAARVLMGNKGTDSASFMKTWTLRPFDTWHTSTLVLLVEIQVNS